MLVTVSRMLVLFVCMGRLFAVEPTFSHRALQPELKLVPQNLLRLIHTKEVQKELEMVGANKALFLEELRVIDGLWWSSRIRSELEQRSITEKQEQLLVDSLHKHFGASAVTRLRQIELQSQGWRLLLRPEVSEAIKLTATQAKELTDLFVATDAATLKLRTASGKPDTQFQEAWQKAAKAERERSPAVLSSQQQSILRSLIGSIFDTQKLERIYPFAPELIDAPWFGSPVSLKGLRGQVVVLHFYAFQCHNCVANFNIYNRWQETLAEQGVKLVGIQTPETSAESNAEKVRQAAIKDQFTFPVLIDLEKKNWDAWGNTMWPTVYIIDKQGYIRFWWQGELNWKGATTDKVIEQKIQQLLAEKD